MFWQVGKFGVLTFCQCMSASLCDRPIHALLRLAILIGKVGPIGQIDFGV